MAEKTEQPTPKKLRDARKKGQVAKSKEVASAAQITAVFAVFLMFTPMFLERLRDLIAAPAKYYETDFNFAVNALTHVGLQAFLAVVIPLLGAAAAAALVGNLVQFGFMFSAESVKPELKKLNPVEGMKKIFSLKNLVEFLKSIAKIAFLSVLFMLVIRHHIADLVKLPHCGMECVPLTLADILRQILLYTIAAFVIVAAVDFIYQKWQFTKDQKMTKDEVKKEFKESEGDPHIKGKRKQLHRELMEANEDDRVRQSKVVVTNPVHIAVALDYREGETPLPVIAAMAEGMRARRIAQIAREEGIPIMQNIPLARGLFRDGQIEQYIPTEMIEPVAEVLRYVNDLEAGNI